METLKQSDLAYLAGLFDAEGSISVIASTYKTQKGKMPRFDLSVSIVNTDKKVLQWILSLGFGGLITEMQRPKENHKQCYHYLVRDNAALNFLKALLPYLRIKEEQARLAVAFQIRKNAQRKLWNRYEPIPVFELRNRRILKHLISSSDDVFVSKEDSHYLHYIAGFFDGEGCILINKSKGEWNKQRSPRYSLRVTLTQKFSACLTWVAGFFGGYVFKHQAGKQGHHWLITDNKARYFLEAILPYLRVKQQQAEIGVDFVKHKVSSGMQYRDGAWASITRVRDGFKSRLEELKRCELSN